MPPPRKIDLLPPELLTWLQEELRARGFADYEAIAEALNLRLADGGLELRIGKSAIHAYGQEFRDYARLQQQAQDEIRIFLEEASLTDEANVTKALFQQLTTIQWRLQMAMAAPDALPDPRGMKDLTTALNNLIRSTSLRDAILAAERTAQAAKLDAAVAAGDISADFRQQAREIMGFA
ncbi:phage protein Gp27 family protein [Frigidibacter oleivorans]|uniref:phage protein Gp27 family protein n=1 Tax=Frigidibacter oleivorans TaxID=2487129 RepID=UPI000F8F6EEF|nr:phage protein Gp27 family protein [Frigidibacter oleivorans]